MDVPRFTQNVEHARVMRVWAFLRAADDLVDSAIAESKEDEDLALGVESLADIQDRLNTICNTLAVDMGWDSLEY